MTQKWRVHNSEKGLLNSAVQSMWIFEVSMESKKQVKVKPLSSGCLVSLNDSAFRETVDESEPTVQSFN